MAKSKPQYRVVRVDSETGAETTVGRHVTAQAARASEQRKHRGRAYGESDWFGVKTIQRRGEKGGR